ncbi:MAG: SDR family NAD(P)-dependent oxidoreductase, partial [Alphaproteobacteria bacterium]
MRVMVTGGGGLVGAKIVRRLLAEGLDVVSLDVGADQPRLAALAGDARLVRIGCDVRDAAAVQDAIRDAGVDPNVHMAALLGP